jgi:serine/threonine protein kinase
MAGTVPYMAPEQLRSDPNHFGPHTDVWGLGVTMYELLCGERPFRADSMSKLMNAVLSTIGPTPPSQIVKSVPETLEQICLKCLSPEPAKRYTTANLLAADLREWRRGIGSPKQKRVFVSHSSKDRDFVEQEIVSILENAGIATWYSKVDIQTASEWGRSILQGLQSSEWFLLVMSSKSISSEWVKDELYWAIENRPERVIPVMIDACDPEQFHIRLKRLQHIDFQHNRDEARRRLIAAFG